MQFSSFPFCSWIFCYVFRSRLRLKGFHLCFLLQHRERGVRKGQTYKSLRTIILLPYIAALLSKIKTIRGHEDGSNGIELWILVPFMIKRNTKVQPPVLMSLIIASRRLGWNDRTNLLIFDCERDNTCNLTHTLCTILCQKSSIVALIVTDRFMEESQPVLAVIREFTSHTTPCHDCWYCQTRHLKPILPWAAEEPLQFCPWRASLGFSLNNGVILTELCSHNNHPRMGTCYCVSHSCSKWNSDLHSLRNRYITHTWVM